MDGLGLTKDNAKKMNNGYLDDRVVGVKVLKILLLLISLFP